ncbi:MAG TPA: hypothetical protein VGY53_05975, partial [Isosphaeraceae bacterium]|nr:hypothetical protein [Isosphaeraceae bacterium]
RRVLEPTNTPSGVLRALIDRYGDLYELGRLADIDVGTLYAFLAGKRQLTTSKIDRLAVVIGFSIVPREPA